MNYLKPFLAALLLTIVASACSSSTRPSAVAALQELTLSSNSVAAGATVIGTVRLTSKAPSGGATITLASNGTSASAPSAVTIPAGEVAADFLVSTPPTAATGPVAITAGYQGVNKSATLMVQGTATSVAALLDLSLSTTTTASGTVVGTITLTSAAPGGGAVVEVASDNNVASTPNSVTVPFGQTTQTFTIETFTPTASRAANITAVYLGVKRTVSLTVLGPVPPGVTLAGTWTGRVHAFPGVPTGTPSIPPYYDLTYVIDGAGPFTAICTLVDSYGTTIAANRTVDFSENGAGSASSYSARCEYSSDVVYTESTDTLSVVFHTDWAGTLIRP